MGNHDFQNEAAFEKELDSRVRISGGILRRLVWFLKAVA